MGEIAGESKNIHSIIQPETGNVGSAEREVRGEEDLLRYLQSLIECPVCLTTIRSSPVTSSGTCLPVKHELKLSTDSSSFTVHFQREKLCRDEETVG